MKLLIRFAGVLLVAALIAIIFFVGWKMGATSEELSCEIDQRGALESAVDKVNKIAVANEKVATAHVVTIDHLETAYKNIKEQTDEYLQSRINNCDTGADGMLLWNSTNTAATKSGR